MGKLSVAAAAATLSLVSACAHHGGGRGDDGGNGVYTAVRISPDPVTLTVPLGGTATQAYIVLGTDDTGEHEITSKCALDVDTNFGSFTSATFNAVPHGGVTSVTATCNSTTGSASLTINLTGTAIVGNAPANSEQLFGGATVTVDGTRQPTIEYPIDQAVAPLNIPPIEVQYTKANNDLFHLNLTSTHAAIDVYTTDPQQTFSPGDWVALAGTAVGDHLKITVEGLTQAAPTMKYASAPATFNLSHDTIDTTAIYWWASSQGNLITQDFGKTTAPTVVKGECSACHSLSRAGSRIGYCRCVADATHPGGNCGTEYVGFLKYDDQSKIWNEQVNANNKTINGTYTTFAPVGNPFVDDTHSVALVTAINGTLNLYDPDTGLVVPSNVNGVAPAANHSALMPDWSPDGKRIAFANTNAAGNAVDLSTSSIGMMSYEYVNNTTHTFAAQPNLVTAPITFNSQSYPNLFFPSFSPDNAYVVFNAARASWRNFTDAKTAGQRLMLVPASGGTPIDLTNINGGTGDHDITWPHWAPGSTADYYWIVYSSEQNYGHEVTAANTAVKCVANGVKQCKQIWIGAISKAALMAGILDPSSPPVWLPGQDTQADNISPYWTVPAGLF
jgi:Tol biopolymer transport system component